MVSFMMKIFHLFGFISSISVSGFNHEWLFVSQEKNVIMSSNGDREYVLDKTLSTTLNSLNNFVEYNEADV